MAGVSAEQFGRMVKRVCAKSGIVMRLAPIDEGELHLHYGAFLVDLSFIDVYYNQESGKTTFAHIDNENRVFGADNRRGIWHWHPLKDPSKHQLTDHEITFAEFLRQLETHLSQQ